MTLTRRDEDELASALRSDAPVRSLRAAAGDLLRRGVETRDVLAALQSLRASPFPDDEDNVLDVMDFVQGFASPGASLHSLTSEARRAERTREAWVPNPAGPETV